MAEIIEFKPSRAYLLKITLEDITPEIWRTFLVPSTIKLPDLHRVIQTVMGWTSSHLHQFRHKDVLYSLPDDESLLEYVDYRKITLSRLLTAKGEILHYDYDFGDGWEHKIELLDIIDDRPLKHPQCLDGERACPPEDCGGPGGFEDMLDILSEPGSEEYEEVIAWLGEDFDRDFFNIKDINRLLKREDYGCYEIYD